VGPATIEWREEPEPTPASGEVVVRVGAALTCGTDLKVFQQGGHARMLVAPCPFGHEVAGTIASLGAGVVGWRVGDRVAVANSSPCGGCDRCAGARENLCRDLRYLNGAFADWLRVPERFVRTSLHHCPERLPFAEAALAEPLACVLHGVEACGDARHGRALVVGAGPIGLLWTAALARGGSDVTLADPHSARLAIGRALGARHAVQARREPAREALTGPGDGFDLTVECSASSEGLALGLETLAPGGVCCAFAGPRAGSQTTLDVHALHYGERALRGVYHYRPADYAAALALLAERSLGVERLLSATRALEDLPWALAEMAARRALKVALIP
jgi:L-iditol 2-dehydrogenase